MYFLNENDTNNFVGSIIDIPTLQFLSDKEKESLTKTIQDVYKENFINNVKKDKDYFEYNISENDISSIFRKFNITDDINDIQLIFKRIIAYNLNKITMYKGTNYIFKFFSQIFENVFDNINYYSVIVTKRKVAYTEDDEEKTKYLLTYELDPLYISDPENVLTHLDENVSLTPKHLMTLNQYKNNNIFPVKTNLVFMQFSGDAGSIDNKHMFNQAVRAVGGTRVSKQNFELVIFNETYNINGNDLIHLIKYLETKRARLYDNDYDFTYQEFGQYQSLILSEEDASLMERVIDRYQKAKYSDRNEMNLVKRSYNMIMKNYNRNSHNYTNFETLKNYLENLYPGLTDNIDKNIEYYSSTEENISNVEARIINVYINLYMQIIVGIDVNDKYYNKFVSNLFLNVIKGDAFTRYFFNPVYHLFAKYFFSAEMEFLNKFTNSVKFKGKFESVSTSHVVGMSLFLKGYYSYTPIREDIFKVYGLLHFKSNNIREKDIIRTKCLSIINDINHINDTNHAKLFSKFNGIRLHRYNKDLPKTFVKSSTENHIYSFDNIHSILLTKENNRNVLSDNLHSNVITYEKDNLNEISSDKILTTPNVNINDSIYYLSDNVINELQRFNYFNIIKKNDTKCIGNYKAYLYFKNTFNLLGSGYYIQSENKGHVYSTYEQEINCYFSDMNDYLYKNYLK